MSLITLRNTNGQSPSTFENDFNNTFEIEPNSEVALHSIALNRLPQYSTAGARSGVARASRSGHWPAGPADFWVLEQHLSRRLCACATVLPHVAGFSAIGVRV